MAAVHSIAGYAAPATTRTEHVLAAMEVLRSSNLAVQPVPALLPLLRSRRVVYRREPRGRDEYLTWWQILETSRPVREWRQRARLGWSEIVRTPALWARLLQLLDIEPAVDDCEGLSMFLGAGVVARRRRRSWGAVQEFWRWGRLAGWHALSAIEVPQHGVVLGEVPISRDVYVLNFPEVVAPRQGMRIALVDASWMGDMERPEGRWVWPF